MLDEIGRWKGYVSSLRSKSKQRTKSAELMGEFRPDLIMRPGETALPRVGGIPVASLWGAATTVLAAIVVVLIITHPSVFGSFTVTSVGALVIVLGAGPVIYLAARQMRLSRSSIDLRLAMRELPPE